MEFERFQDVVYFGAGDELWINHYTIEDNFVLQLDGCGTSHALVALFATEGQIALEEEDTRIKERLSLGNHMVFLCKKGILVLKATSGTAKMSCAVFGADMLQSHLPPSQLFMQYSAENDMAHVIVCQTSKSVKTILQQCQAQNTDTYVNRILKKARLLELLAEQLKLLETPAMAHHLPLSITAKMAYIRQLIGENTNQNFKLLELARLVGTNQQYLKKQFKLLYGTTVFKYMVACKMNRSKQLINQNQLTIADVAQAVGYKHHTHFTHAFKKHFGFLPKHIKLID